MNANAFLRNKSVHRLDTRPSPRVRGSGFARLTSCFVKTESGGLRSPWFCQTDTTQITMKVLIFPLIVLLVLCYYVTSQSVSSPVPTRTLTPMPIPAPTPTSTTSPFSHPLDCPFVDNSLCDPLCPYINFECEPGLVPSTRNFSQSDICIFDTDFIGTCSFVMSNGTTIGLKC